MIRSAFQRACGALVICLAGFVPSVGLANHCELPHAFDRPRIGLALGGGGARGYAHVGVLKYLEELRIPVDYVAGTSMGSIIGGFMAIGMQAGEIETLIRETDWNALFSGKPPRRSEPIRRKTDDELGLFGPKFGVSKGGSFLPGGVVAGQNVMVLFENVIGQRVQVNDFDDLPLPFRAISTDIVTGDMVVLSDGSLSAAMRASMAVPGVFDPVRVDDRVLVDGGLVRNLPVDVVRDMGADIVIAVDVGTPLMEADRLSNALMVIQQMTGLMVIQNTEDQVQSLGDSDVLIRPDIGFDMTSADFNSFEDGIPLGYEGAKAARGALGALSVSPGDYAAWRTGIEACVSGVPEVRFVRLDNRSRFSDDVLMNMVNVTPGAPLDTDAIDRDLENIYGLGFIRQAHYTIVEENGETGVEITVIQDQRGTDFLETGLTIAGNGRSSTINLLAGYLVTDLDERGSEARVVAQVGDDFGLLGDVYKYLDDRRRWYLKPELAYSRRDLPLFTDTGAILGEADIQEAWAEATLGREFGNDLAIYTSLASYTGKVKPQIGLPFEADSFDGGEWTLGLLYDSLDNLFLPGDGGRITMEYIDSADWLGADDAYQQVRVSGLLARTWGRHNALLGLRYNTTLDDQTVPLYAYFTGGGFLNMSGYEPAELAGPNFGFAGLGYRFRMTDNGLLPGYVGGTLEYGNAAEDRDDIFSKGLLNGSLYFAYDTPLGPIYLGWGWNEQRSGLIFLRLGAVVGDQAIGRR